MGGQSPSIGRYNRIPTRQKAQLFWFSVAFCIVSYQILKFTIQRVVPKRGDYYYDSLNRFKAVPEKIMEHERSMREMRETLTVHNAITVPSPGEFNGSLQEEFSPGRIGVVSSHTNKTGAVNKVST